MDSSTARDYVHFATDAVRNWSSSGLELHHLRRELRRLESTRSQLLYDLGEAVYAGNETAREAILESLRSLDRELIRRRAETRQVVRRYERHLQREKLSVQPTKIIR